MKGIPPASRTISNHSPEDRGMGGHSLFRTLSIEEIGFEKNTITFFDKSLNPSDEIDGPAKSPQDLVIIITLASDN